MKPNKPEKRLEATPELAAARIASRPDYANYGTGVPAAVIEKAVARLGLPFSPSYKWFLANYGVGYLGGYELNGLFPEFYEDAIGDIVVLALREETAGRPGIRQLELITFEGDETYYFDTTTPDRAGEYPIKCRDVTMEGDEVFAGNFYEFLIKLIPAMK